MKTKWSFIFLLLFTACKSLDNSGFIPEFTEGGIDFSRGVAPPPADPSDEEKERVVIADNQIKIITFNVRTSTADTGTSNAWTERRSGIPLMFYIENPTIFGLQEAQYEQMTYIKNALDGYDCVGVSRDTGSESGAGERMPIFWKTSDVEMDSWGTFWLSPTPATPSTGWADDSQYRRCSTWARFKHLKTGNYFFYINTHLDLVLENRIYGMSLIVSKLRELNPGNDPAFLTGDMNEKWPSSVFDPLSGVMENVRETAPETDHATTYNAFGGSGGSIIDFIFYSGLIPRSYRTINDKWNGIKYLSDHYPAGAVLEFAD